MPEPATGDLRTNYDYVVSTDVVEHVRRLLHAADGGGGSWTVWQIARRPRILDLAGLGRELWEGVDPRRYIDELRGEWDAR